MEQFLLDMGSTAFVHSFFGSLIIVSMCNQMWFVIFFVLQAVAMYTSSLILFSC